MTNIKPLESSKKGSLYDFFLLSGHLSETGKLSKMHLVDVAKLVINHISGTIILLSFHLIHILFHIFIHMGCNGLDRYCAKNWSYFVLL